MTHIFFREEKKKEKKRVQDSVLGVMFNVSVSASGYVPKSNVSNRDITDLLRKRYNMVWGTTLKAMCLFYQSH